MEDASIVILTVQLMAEGGEGDDIALACPCGWNLHRWPLVIRGLVILGLSQLAFRKFRSRMGSHRAQTGLQLASKQKTPPSSGVLIESLLARGR
jgi:hypothetical protein